MPDFTENIYPDTMKYVFLTFASMFMASLLCEANAQPVVDGGDAVECRSLLFSGGDGVSKFYRIPAIVTADDGSLVAVADRRLDSNKDLPGRIDVVCRISKDGGESWSKAIVVASNDSVGGFGDPALGVAPDGTLVCVMTHGQGLWEAGPGSHPYIYVSRSTDGGQNWSVPTDITPGLFSQSEGEAPVRCVAAFATSGRMLTDGRGTMWFVLVARPHEEKWSTLQCFACYSTDGGRTWAANPMPVDDDADESKIVECADGTLLMSIRNRRKGYRKFSRSTDGGATWSAPERSATLPDPACNGDVVALADGTLIHSINDSGTAREKVSLFASGDNGSTWRKLATVCPVGSAYSSITLLPDGKLGILAEEASSLGGFRLWYSRINLKKLLEK